MQFEIDGDDSFCTRKLYKLHYTFTDIASISGYKVYAIVDSTFGVQLVELHASITRRLSQNTVVFFFSLTPVRKL